MARSLTRPASIPIWPAFTDAMLAFVLVLVLLLTYQVGRALDIAGPDQLEILRDQRRVQNLVDSLGYAGVTVEWGVGRQDLTFGSEVLFESGSADLNADGQRLLRDLATTLSTGGVSTLTEIQVSGHTDDVGTDVRRFATNWELSTARATRVVRALSESGVDASAVRLSATGYGEFVPRSGNDTEAGRAANRRIELRLLYARDNESADAP